MLTLRHPFISYFDHFPPMPSISRLFPVLLASFLIALPTTRLGAQDAPAPAAKEGIAAEFKSVFDKIVAKIQAGQKTEAELAAEIAAIDAILAQHAADKTDETAMVALMKARLYLEVFENNEKGIALLKDVKKDFPESNIAKNIDQAIASIEQQAAAEKILAVGQPFPAFDEKDLNGQSLSPANFKGKVVLIDFWATWCGPCVAELPNVLAAYEKFHGKGFEIIGISLDQSRDALTTFIKEKNMPWAQYFDGLGWKNKLGEQFGIHSIPATYLLDRDGKIVAKGLRGPDLASKLAELLK